MSRRKFVQRRKAEKERISKLRQLIIESRGHDRETCKCKGCKAYAIVSVIVQSGRLLEIVNGWDNIQPDEFARNLQNLIRYKLDKKIDVERVKKLMIEKGVPPQTADETAKRMIDPIFIVMWKVPPMGLLKEI